MRLHNRLHNREAQAVVTGAAARFVGAVETLEDVRQILGGNAGASVPDDELGAGVVGLRGDSDFAAGVV